jgi:Tfp pilus assembly protein FimT
MRLKSAARDLHSNLQKMKVEAIKRNSEVVMLISINPANSYKIFVDEDGSGAQNGAEPWISLVDDSGAPAPDTVYNMPGNTTLTSSTSASMGFNPRGLLLDATTNVEVLPDGQSGFLLTLNNDIGNSYTVSVYIAGRIETKKL